MNTSDAAPGGETLVQSVSLMGTVVTIQVVLRDEAVCGGDCGAAVARAIAWFREVEASCNRFDPGSEIASLAEHAGKAIPVSPTLFHATEVALAVAAASDGAFDPAIGAQMTRRGFNRSYLTGETHDAPGNIDADVSFRDVLIDPQRRTIMLRRPLVLDLGAVAKGLAIDLAARELAPFHHYAIDAGGDLYLSGRNEDGQPWRVGIRHPREADRIIATLRVSGRAVCTSGDYERPAPGGDGHHIVDPRTGSSGGPVASVSVVAPAAVLADALGTAAFVLGVRDGLALLERHGVDGLIVTASLHQHATRGMHRDYELRPAAVAARGPAVLRHAQGPADDRVDDAGGDRRPGRRSRPARARPR